MPDNEQSDFAPKIILGIAAHPDDLDFSASGSFAKWAKDGADVYYLILTDGSKGTNDRSLTLQDLVKIRRNEQINAAKAVGAKNVFFLNYPDAMLEVTMDLKRDIVRVIRRIKPDTVVTTDPTVLYELGWNFINHSDHRAAGQAAIDSVFPLARDFLVFPELISKENLEPHKVKNLLLVNFTKANLIIDIGSTIDQKLAALREHKSQISEDSIKMVTQRSKKMAEEDGFEYAERFVKIEVMG